MSFFGLCVPLFPCQYGDTPTGEEIYHVTHCTHQY
jgi:hypothetical protein